MSHGGYHLPSPLRAPNPLVGPIWCDRTSPSTYLQNVRWDQPHNLPSIIVNPHDEQDRIPLPNGIPPSIYDTFTLLCAAGPYGGLSNSNMGGVCSWIDPRRPIVDFALDVGDSSLFDYKYLRALCRNHCHCVGVPGTPGTAPGASMELPLEQRLQLQLKNFFAIQDSLFTEYPKDASLQVTYSGTLIEAAIWCQPPGSISSYPPRRSVPEVLTELNGGSDILPNGVSAQKYGNWTSFCASWAFGGLFESNLGGVCIEGLNGERIVDFTTNTAASTFFGYPDPRIIFLNKSRAYCKLNCLCAGKKDVFGNTAKVTYAAGRPQLRDLMKQKARFIRAWKGGAFNSGPYQTGGHSSESGSSSSDATSEEVCGSNRACDNFRCGLNQAADCFCQAVRAGTSQSFVLAGCISTRWLFDSISTSALGKRDSLADREWSCPCNASYVSHGCCGAESGMVWESPENRLGDVMAGSETSSD